MPNMIIKMRIGSSVASSSTAERLEQRLNRGRDVLYEITAEGVVVRYKPSPNWPKRGRQYYVDHTDPCEFPSMVPLPIEMPVAHALAAVSMKSEEFDAYMETD